MAPEVWSAGRAPYRPATRGRARRTTRRGLPPRLRPSGPSGRPSSQLAEASSLSSGAGRGARGACQGSGTARAGPAGLGSTRVYRPRVGPHVRNVEFGHTHRLSEFFPWFKQFTLLHS